MRGDKAGEKAPGDFGGGGRGGLAAGIAFISSVFRGAAANSAAQNRIVPPLAPCLSRCSYSMVDRTKPWCTGGVLRP